MCATSGERLIVYFDIEMSNVSGMQMFQRFDKTANDGRDMIFRVLPTIECILEKIIAVYTGNKRGNTETGSVWRKGLLVEHDGKHFIGFVSVV